jgi:chromosome segregation ATPase
MENKYLLALKKEYEGTQRAAAEARASLDSMEQQIGHADGEIQKLSEETSRVKERRMTALTRNADIIEENDRLRHEIKELQSNTGIAVSLKALRLKVTAAETATRRLPPCQPR